MKEILGERILKHELSRRDFLWLLSAGSTAVGLPLLGGCAADPVTGKDQIVLMSEKQEIAIDQKQAPHQFSADYGVIPQGEINAYINDLGQKMAAHSHRPQMPYSFQAVNATYINAYTFPGGSVATTRGILIDIDNEAELAALLGHEIGHVNARHAAERATRSMLASSALAGVGVALAASDYKEYAGLVGSLGGVGAGALLAHYSRDNEREADALGMRYMADAGHSPDGMIELMQLLRSESRNKPSAIELMFATHPMSEERYKTARQQASTYYIKYKNRPVHRDRYMDNIAGLRRMKPAIEELQKGEKQMRGDNYLEAERHFSRALRYEPDDYAALVMMSKCQIGLEQPRRARHYAQLAKKIDPKEAQAHHVAGISQLMRKDFEAAYQDFNDYEKLLPGNPNTIFLEAVALEGSGNKKASARQYYRYLQTVKQGEQSKHAHQRLKAWGYLR